jgi:hypothetical protein
MSAGNLSLSGILAPPTRQGITSFFCCRAGATSNLTQSSDRSMRRVPPPMPSTSSLHTLSNQCLVVTSNSAMEDRRKHVLHVSPDRTLARSRHQVLSAVGFHVFCVYTVSAALFEISLGRCGTLLLCRQLKRESRETLATFFHEHCPEPFIVTILAHENDYCPPQTHARVVHSSDHVALLRVFREKLAA